MKGSEPRRAPTHRPLSHDGNPPSSARRRLPRLADGDDGFTPYDQDEGFIQLGDGEDWPPQWGAVRAGIP
jgi:hypothetical protein